MLLHSYVLKHRFRFILRVPNSLLVFILFFLFGKGYNL